jgi:hypothetical protein
MHGLIDGRTPRARACAPRAEMCRIPLNPAPFAVYLRIHTENGEAACC